MLFRSSVLSGVQDEKEIPQFFAPIDVTHKLKPEMHTGNGRIDLTKITKVPLAKGLNDPILEDLKFKDGRLEKIDFSDLIMSNCSFERVELRGCRFDRGFYERLSFLSKARNIAFFQESFPTTIFWVFTVILGILPIFLFTLGMEKSTVLATAGVVVTLIVLITLFWQRHYAEKNQAKIKLWDQYTNRYRITDDHSFCKSIALGSMSRMRDITFKCKQSPLFENYIRQQQLCDEKWIKATLSSSFLTFWHRLWRMFIGITVDSGRSFVRIVGVGLFVTLISGITLTYDSNLNSPPPTQNAVESCMPSCFYKQLIHPVAAASTETEKAFFMFRQPDDLTRNFFTPFYFSLVTITTLGYGDITPLNYPAQIFAVLLALIGFVLLGLMISVAYEQLQN